MVYMLKKFSVLVFWPQGTWGLSSLNRDWTPTPVLKSESHSVVCDSLQPRGLYSLWNSPGQNPREGGLSLFQGIFPTQGLNPGLPHCGRILYQLSHKGSWRILEWVAYPFSSGSSQSRNRTGISCIAGRFLTSWATREVRSYKIDNSWKYTV